MLKQDIPFIIVVVLRCFYLNAIYRLDIMFISLNTNNIVYFFKQIQVFI